MATSPVLETTRLRLEPFSIEKHLSERYVKWLGDPAVTRFSEQRFLRHSLDSCRRYALSYQGTPHHFWALVVADPTVGHVGNLNAYLNDRYQSAELGILVGEPAALGRGYAAEAWMAATDFLLRDHGLRKVSAGTMATNLRMCRLMDRTGMTPDGRRERHFLWDGEEVDLVHAAFFRDSWLARFPLRPPGGAFLAPALPATLAPGPSTR